MTDNSTIDPPFTTDAGTALRVEQLREEYGEDGLTANELVMLAGVSRAMLDTLEHGRELPSIVEALFRIAFALQVPVEALVNERKLRRARQRIARRRVTWDGESSRRPMGFTVPEL